VKKIIGMQLPGLSNFQNAPNPIQLLNDLEEDLRGLILENNLDKSSALGKGLSDAISKIQAVELSILENTSRSRTSSNTSAASLGDRIATHDKETFFYTYKWTTRNGAHNSWIRGNQFRDWVEDSYKRLPQKNSELNCWEAVMTLLFQYHAVTKAQIQGSYSKCADGTGDTAAVSQLFGLDETCTQTMPAESLRKFVQTGDILVFQSNRGTEIGHVALVLDNFEKLWVVSHWCLPKEKMIRLTTNRIFETSKVGALKAFSTEVEAYKKDVAEIQERLSHLLQNTEGAVPSFQESDVSVRGPNEVHALLEVAQSKYTGLAEELASYELKHDEVEILAPIWKQAFDLISDFRGAIEKFKGNETVLGILYDYIDSFEQKNCLNALEKLEYLVSDTVTVSTKFRPYFQD